MENLVKIIFVYDLYVIDFIIPKKIEKIVIKVAKFNRLHYKDVYIKNINYSTNIYNVCEHFGLVYNPQFYYNNCREIIYKLNWSIDDHALIIKYYNELIKHIISFMYINDKSLFLDYLNNISNLCFEDMYKEAIVKNILK